MTEATPKPVDSAPARDPARPTPGEYLRKLREEKGHTHAAVGSALHLTVHYVKALEGDEYGKLPGLTFVKGYLRSYARFLNADVDNVLARFDEHIAGLLDEGRHTARVQRHRRRQDQALRWGIGAGLVVVAGLAAGWWFMSDDQAPAAVTIQNAAPAQQTAAVSSTGTAPAVTPRSSTPLLNTYPAPTQPTNSYVASQTLRAVPDETVSPVDPPQTVATDAAPAAAADELAAPDATTTTTAVANVLPATATAPGPAEPTPATITPAANGARQVSLVSAGNDELRVSFKGNSWIEVDDGSLQRLYNDMLSAGDTLTIRGVAPFHVLLGDASQVDVSLNATAVDISADIRDDSTARLVVGAPASEAAETTEGAPL